MNTSTSRALLAAGGFGPPLTQLAIKHFGRSGAIAGAAACGALLVRDFSLLVSGTTRQLKRGPAGLLVGETVIGAVALGLTIRLVVDEGAMKVAMGDGRSTPEIVRRIALATVYAIHTARYTIYLRPDRGRRAATTESTPAVAGA
jgi:hypothetical protein